MTGEGVKVTADLKHIHWQMTDSLRAINQCGHAERAGFGAQLAHGIDGAQRVGDMHAGHELHLPVQQGVDR